MAIETDQLKQKINQSFLLSESEKKEWQFLLPKMSDAQRQELGRILEIRMPQKESGTSPTPSSSPPRAGGERGGGRESGREPNIQPFDKAQGRHTPYPPAERAGNMQNTLLTSAAPSLSPSPQGREIKEGISSSSLGGAAEERDLTVFAMRASSSVYDFLDSLAASWAVAVKSREKNPQEILADFQKSPLYAAYVEAGREMLMGEEPRQITRPEFEAIAEFRTSLKKILSS